MAGDSGNGKREYVYELEVEEDVAAWLMNSQPGVRLEDIGCIGRVVCGFFLRVLRENLLDQNDSTSESVVRETEIVTQREMVLGAGKIEDDITLLLAEMWRWREYKKMLCELEGGRR